ncbi:uncharacterized protein B0H18DRAFT_70612 [Fomitopsis serialis]|uniref:uncharacterized protein n=1 Tax=Fomitopsis serialis TaxID=139415 RepID=UPI00200760CD|nr:uncharacterized protein B0H18DRAFT_70612 [Neoantrodia serialis]KAH9931927.1 hypothetical protein B0H18DRAFT_70612 [Neoantrodia serialis]
MDGKGPGTRQKRPRLGTQWMGKHGAYTNFRVCSRQTVCSPGSLLKSFASLPARPLVRPLSCFPACSPACQLSRSLADLPTRRLARLLACPFSQVYPSLAHSLTWCLPLSPPFSLARVPTLSRGLSCLRTRSPA